MSPRSIENAPHGRSTASRHAARLLADLGLRGLAVPAPYAATAHPDEDWMRSGCRGVSPDPPAPVAACTKGAWAALNALSPRLGELGVDPCTFLGERVALGAVGRAGRATAGGAGRLVRARDGWLAVQLPRPDDVAALPAWLECDAALATQPDPLDRIAPVVATRRRDALVERARLLGLAVAAVADRRGEERVPWVVRTPPSRGDAPRRSGSRLRVLDLSTLWAGPLCGRVLGWTGADVVKVEHAGRVDGARLGPRAFFDAMNGEKSMCAADPTTRAGADALRALIGAADVVVESARPRALAQLGLDAQACVDARPGLVWVSITGYGRPAPRGDWVAFGDDAAVAAGLFAVDATGAPLFVGDALADPLAGLHAAVAALAGVRLGGGLFDVPLYGVARLCRETPVAEAPRPPSASVDDGSSPIAAPPSPASVASSPDATPATGAHLGPVSGPARAVGADTDAVFERWLAGATRPRARMAAPAC